MRTGQGPILVTGGSPHADGGPESSSTPGTRTAELFDPSSLKFGPTGPQTEDYRGATATLLGNGQVLLAGGADDSGPATTAATLVSFTTGAGGTVVASVSVAAGVGVA